LYTVSADEAIAILTANKELVVSMTITWSESQNYVKTRKSYHMYIESDWLD